MWDAIPQVAKEKLERSFDIEYAHNSTAIEGNTLTLIQTKAILEDGLSVGGKTCGRSMRWQTTTRRSPM